ncbi:MAG: hypothetical protein AB7T49_11065 [Oligoflexales bacterium]
MAILKKYLTPSLLMLAVVFGMGARCGGGGESQSERDSSTSGKNDTDNTDERQTVPESERDSGTTPENDDSTSP